MAIKILGTGSYLPEKVVTNDELSKSLDTSDEWIYSHSGIHSRHVAADGEATASMAAAAGRKAMQDAGVDPSEIGMVIVATCSPDYHPLPSCACLVQHELGLVNAFAFDLQAACSGFIFSLEQARGYLTLHPDRKALIIGSETLSRVVDWTDRGICILFGDGAGAAVVGAVDEKVDSEYHVFLGSDGSGYDAILREGGTHGPQVVGMREEPLLQMKGKEVFQFAIKTMPMVVEKLCAEAGITANDIDLLIPHQANLRIIESSAKRLSVPMDKVFVNLTDKANTSGASIPLAIDEARRTGVLKDGMRTCLVGFGSGLTYGGVLTRWPYV